MVSRGARRTFLPAVCLGTAAAWPAWGAAYNYLHLVCPCSAEISADGTGTVSFGVRNYSPDNASEALQVQLGYVRSGGKNGIRAPHWALAEEILALSPVPANGHLKIIGRTFAHPHWPIAERLFLLLHEGEGIIPSRVVLTNLAGAGPGRFIDHLQDSDGDGVGDVNESLAGTDPENADSTPGEQEIDLLALHLADLREHYDGDHLARISHLATVTNRIYRANGAGIRFRIVGAVERGAHRSRGEELQPLYGADLNVAFEADSESYCGFAPLNGLRENGFLEDIGTVIPTVVTGCRDTIMAHELGHALGLDHPFAQSVSGGTYPWSRGHYVGDVDLWRGTLMSYGHTFKEVIANPSADCGGEPCGKARGSRDSADALASLRITRFQVARWEESKPDTDGDGTVDPVDAFPTDADEWSDLDGDGVGDNADPDDDGDGAADEEDAFPRNADEWADTDGDGVGDNGDAFPDDPAETSDRDGDGVGDNGDVFLDDGSEWVDTDGDGVGDNGDAFPDDPAEASDRDGDGVGDGRDAFPDDGGEWADADGDGVGDNSDALVDTDGDGVANVLDPDDDGDGIPDAMDTFPLDPAGLFYKLTGEPGRLTGFTVSSAGDVDGDGAADVIVVEPGAWLKFEDTAGAYVVAAADLHAADSADGLADRTIRLENAAAQPHSRRLVGDPLLGGFGMGVGSIGDIDGDGLDDVIAAGRVIGTNRHRGSIYIASGADITSTGGGRILDVHGEAWWRFHGHDNPAPGERGVLRGAGSGENVASAGDVDGDGVADVIFGSVGDDGGDGAVRYFAPGAASLLMAADLRRSVATGRSRAEPILPSGAWRLVGEDGGPSRAGIDVGSAGDIDGDGLGDVFVLASDERYDEELRNPSPTGALYLIAAADLPALDAADGTGDRKVSLGTVADAPASWKLTGSRPRDLSDAFNSVGPVNVASAGDVDGDSVPELLVGAPTVQPDHLNGNLPWGAAYVVSPARLAEADAADGSADGTVTLGHAAAWTFRSIGDGDRFDTDTDCCTVEPAGDVDGDGLADILVGAQSRHVPHLAYLVASRDLPAADRADGEADGVVDLANVAAQPGSWRIRTGRWRWPGYYFLDVASAGDVDRDGVPDLIIGEAEYWSEHGYAYLLSGAHLALFDERDGAADGTIDLERVRFRTQPPTSPRQPSAVRPPNGVAVQPGGDVATLDLSRMFSPGRDGGALRFEARSSDPALATAAVTGGQLTIMSSDGDAEGHLTIAVTAINALGFRTTHQIEVDVSFSPRLFMRGWRLGLPRDE